MKQSKSISDFEKVSNHIENLILNLAADHLNPAKLFSLTIQSIEYLENEYSHFTGDQKKDLLIEAFRDLCSSTNHPSLSLELKMEIKNFLNDDLETVIDSVIQVSNGNFQINERQQALLIKCIIKLCKCFMKQHNKKINKRRP